MKKLQQNRNGKKLEAITPECLIVGIDIAKEKQWARFVDYRGLEQSKALEFYNNKTGFEIIVASMESICKMCGFSKVIVGMEPTGHYWKPLANYLIMQGITVVMVNPYHVKKSKELDDNSPTKSDKKDALTIAKLVKDGRYYEVYMPNNVFGELRVLSTARFSLMKRHNALKNTIHAVLDEYFPELETVFKHPVRGKASLQLLKSCPFPAHILELGEEGVLCEIKKAVKKTVGRKKAKQLVETAKTSIGVNYGLAAAKLKLGLMVEELELLIKQLEQVEANMAKAMTETGFGEIVLSIQGIGVISAASLFGEIGDPLRFDDPRQIGRLAGYGLVEDSSGKSKSGTVISKRGRKHLRCVLYQMALVMVATNSEMKKLYAYLKTRRNNPLKKKQALVVISKKIITIIYHLIKKKVSYRAEDVLGEFRRNQIEQAA